MKFYETKMGQDFFTRQIPQLTETLREIAAALKQPAAPDQPAAVDRRPELALTEEETDILSNIYYCDYMPESMERRENDPFDRDVKQAVNALLKSLSPEQKKLFLQYESAENARVGAIACRAYKDGIRLAVQIFMAGRPFRPQQQ